jgi:putative PIN family toxin of toxin-antitoxin system
VIPVVLDASVVAAACGWTSEAYQCVVLVARRRLRSFVTQEILAELRGTLTKMEMKGAKFRRSPWPALAVLIGFSRLVSPAMLGKQRSRDPGDDPYLACALAARAEFVITRDPDLLELEKSFGIQILTPRAFLSGLQAGL